MHGRRDDSASSVIDSAHCAALADCRLALGFGGIDQYGRTTPKTGARGAEQTQSLVSLIRTGSPNAWAAATTGASGRESQSRSRVGVSPPVR